jgi:hypothetical protein
MKDAADEVRHLEQLRSRRGVWENHWEEIAERVLPRHRGFVGDRTAGEKRTEKVFDSKPMTALDRFAAVMDSTLTPMQQKWHNLKTNNEELNRDFEVQDWFYRVNNILYSARYAPKANFSGQNYERWVSVGAFGTGALFIDYMAGSGLRYRTINLKNLYIETNHQGVIDTVYRVFKYNARQAQQAFGSDLPEKILTCLENPNKANEEFEFVHCVRPNSDYDEGRVDARGKLYSSKYVMVSEKVQVGEESGYNSFPFSISRYVTAPDEVYGRSPAMSVLPDIKMLNEMSKTDIRAAHKLIDPPILLHDDGVLGGGARSVNMRPGGLNVGGVDRNGRALIQPFNTGARVDINEVKMEQRRAAIDDAFLTTLFQILVDTPRMTATEALIRAQEKGMLLAPTVGRQQSESLGPLIEREMDLLMFHRVLPPMPDVLREAGGEYEIIYDSPMSRMMRAEELVGVQRSMELLTPFAQLDSRILDIFNKEELARLTTEVSGVPTRVINSPDQMRQIREAQRQQDEQQAMVESAQPIAGAMKDVAQANQLLTGVA